MRTTFMLICSVIALTDCYVDLRPGLSAFPENRGAANLTAESSAFSHAYETDPAVKDAHAKVMKIGFGDPDWTIERSPEGAILRRTVTVHVGFQRDSGCAVDMIPFEEESTGPNTWAAVRLFANPIKGARSISCDALR
jgi:hypothetical protein